jgi:diguanylate cyclase (GGDEF)-like protein
MGGEEFTVLLERTTRDVARLQAETVRSVLNAGSDGLPGYTVSAGIAQWQGGERLRDLLRNADQALYTAKGAGRNRVHMFLPTTAAPSDTRLAASG